MTDVFYNLDIHIVDDEITEYINPVTRTRVALDPPFPFRNDNQDEVEQLRLKLAGFCCSAWETTHRRDPKVLDPYKILDGTEPIDALEDRLVTLIHEYGPATVATILTRLDPGVLDFVAAEAAMQSPVG